jgi:NAD(P)-dependent dehydrogenase (short-subunit alcohol dehydrogenase family)
MRLKDKVAVITGGACGIGRATAELFAREGAHVAVADFDSAQGCEAVQAIRGSGGDAVFFALDVSDPAQVARTVDAVLQTWKRIDVLVNAAAILRYGTVIETDEQTWNRVLAVNLTGTYLFCRAAVPHMIRQKRGAIVNIASTTGAHDACARAVAYVTSKGGVTLLTRAMSIDHAKDGIRVNAVCPGPTDTQMLRTALTPEELEAFAKTYPMGRLGRPEEIAAAVLFLASDEASFVTGAAVYVDGGQTAEI